MLQSQIEAVVDGINAMEPEDMKTATEMLVQVNSTQAKAFSEWLRIVLIINALVPATFIEEDRVDGK